MLRRALNFELLNVLGVAELLKYVKFLLRSTISSACRSSSIVHNRRRRTGLRRPERKSGTVKLAQRRAWKCSAR